MRCFAERSGVNLGKRSIMSYSPYLSIRKPNIDPRIKVIIEIGINVSGSFQPIIIAAGNKTKNGMIMPFAIPFILRVVIAIKKPEITHSEKADKFASHVNF